METRRLSKSPKLQWRRPARVIIDCLFEEGNRKITAADLERAANAAAAAYRTSLESRHPQYKIAELTATSEYAYIQHRRQFDA